MDRRHTLKKMVNSGFDEHKKTYLAELNLMEQPDKMKKKEMFEELVKI
jgi:hypothetical protein